MMKVGAISEEPEAVECSMCGDVGLQDKLFLCEKRDCHRHQHTYCSNWYPEERSTHTGMCNWCAAAAATAKANAEYMNTTTDSGRKGGGAAASVSGTVKGGTMGRPGCNSAVSPLKIITSNNMNMSKLGCWSGGGATPQAATAWAKSGPAPAMRTPAGRRYKLVSEM